MLIYKVKPPYTYMLLLQFIIADPHLDRLGKFWSTSSLLYIWRLTYTVGIDLTQNFELKMLKLTYCLGIPNKWTRPHVTYWLSSHLYSLSLGFGAVSARRYQEQ